MLRKLLAPAIVLLVTIALVVPGYAFVQETLPWSPTVYPPPSVSLRAAVRAETASFPNFQRSIPVLSYRDVSGRRGATAVSPQRFAEQLAALKAAGFATIGLRELRLFLRGLPVALPRRPIAITFDDTVASELTTADPILREYGMQAISFLTTGTIAQKIPSYYLTWADIRRLSRNGRWDFGIATHSGHAQIPLPEGGDGLWLTNRRGLPGSPVETFTQWQERVAQDLNTSSDEYQRHLGSPPTAFAFPYVGKVLQANDRNLPTALREMLADRFSVAFGAAVDETRVVRLPSDSLFLPRRVITAQYDALTLLRGLREMVPAPPPSDPLSLPLTAKGGTCLVDAGRLILSTMSYVSCVAVASTTAWSDYSLSATLRRTARNATTILAVRYGADGSRLELAIGMYRAVLRQRTHEGWQTLGTVPLVNGDVQSVSVRVTGRQAMADVDGRALAAVLDDSLSRGGSIAFALASPQATTATMTGLRMSGV